MHDIKWIRENRDAFDASMRKRGLSSPSEMLLELDDKARAHQTELQQLQSERNALAKKIGISKSKGEDASELMAESKRINESIARKETRMNEGHTRDSLLEIQPNILDEKVSEGADESNNVIQERDKIPPKRDVPTPKDHVALGEALGMMDFESATKMSGARFVVLKKDLARLERALASFMLDIHTGEFGYTEINPPYLVKDSVLRGTGQLPKFFQDLFSTLKDQARTSVYTIEVFKEQAENNLKNKGFNFSGGDLLQEQGRLQQEAFDSLRLWLIPTAEVSLTNIVREEILDPKSLPMRMTAWTPCFRSEAGAAGKDTKGMIRQHQFSKVELVSIVTPEESEDEHERMTGCAEEILKRLGLHYRVMLLCAGDTGFSARKTYDIEVWLPGQNTFREISSCSNCGDFQARRMKARYRKSEKETAFVHTLNGSGLAVGRTLIAVLENYQQPDGSIAIPEALQPYMNNKTKIEK